jgi:hypothetical protein
MRKAPRNFTLTPKMVGKNPPLPRSYPAFRFVTALASLLLFFTVGLNFLAPQLASQAPAFGMGGGGAPEVFSAQAPAPAATEAAADAFATEAPALEAPAEPPAAELAPLPTATAAAAGEESATTRESEAPSEKEGVTGNAVVQDQSQVQNQRTIPPAWQLLLAGIAVLGGMVMLLMRQSAASRWRQKS